MSFSKPYWVPPSGNQKQRELWWTNSVYYSHEDWCGCSHFAHHLLGAVSGIPRDLLLQTTESLEKQLRQQKCRSLDTTGTAAGEDQENTEHTGNARKRTHRWPRRRRPTKVLFEDPDSGRKKTTRKVRRKKNF